MSYRTNSYTPDKEIKPPMMQRIYQSNLFTVLSIIPLLLAPLAFGFLYDACGTSWGVGFSYGLIWSTVLATITYAVFYGIRCVKVYG